MLPYKEVNMYRAQAVKEIRHSQECISDTEKNLMGDKFYCWKSISWRLVWDNEIEDLLCTTVLIQISPWQGSGYISPQKIAYVHVYIIYLDV